MVVSQTRDMRTTQAKVAEFLGKFPANKPHVSKWRNSQGHIKKWKPFNNRGESATPTDPTPSAPAKASDSAAADDRQAAAQSTAVRQSATVNDVTVDLSDGQAETPTVAVKKRYSARGFLPEEALLYDLAWQPPFMSRQRRQSTTAVQTPPPPTTTTNELETISELNASKQQPHDSQLLEQTTSQLTADSVFAATEDVRPAQPPPPPLLLLPDINQSPRERHDDDSEQQQQQQSMGDVVQLKQQMLMPPQRIMDSPYSWKLQVCRGLNSANSDLSRRSVSSRSTTTAATATGSYQRSKKRRDPNSVHELAKCRYLRVKPSVDLQRNTNSRQQ